MASSDDGIDRALAERGCALVVGTVGRDGSPHAGRGWGLTLSPASPSPVRLLLDAGDEVTLANLRHARGGRIAVTGADVETLRSFQLKGRVVAIEDATDDDLEKLGRYCDDFFTDIEVTDGTPRHLTERLRPATCVACTIEVDEAFDQTPGPGAGSRVDR
ncbi:MAG: pyridoxamine 5'-phosphate oxidase family protein [Acidimicrobiales bacterium]|nr:pyridoxamine 5'-phosphate oxidase family protein [Acidimicrobiales bacterium]